MTLTREALRVAAKPRFEQIEIEGFGKVGIRSRSQVMAMKREASLYNPDGSPNHESMDLQAVYLIIDQICKTAEEPLFTDDDIEWLAASDASKLQPLIDAIIRFNGPEAKNE